MVLSARLQIKQTQSLVITPQLLQAIRLLQMPAAELEAFVAAEIEQNPLLQPADTAADAQLPPEPAPETSDHAGEVDADPADLFPEQTGSDWGMGASPPGLPSRNQGASPDEYERAFGIAAAESLTVMLERRIRGELASSAGELMIALALLQDLDEAGYLRVDLQEVASRFAAPLSQVETVLRRCQDLAPTGIFARDLAECLSLQLAELDRLDPAMQAMLANLDLLAARDWAALGARCGVDRADLEEMVAEIRALDPKPGLAFEREPPRTVTPDVLVREGPDGAWIVELNDAALPRVIVDRAYFTTVSQRCSADSDRRYLSECLQKASWLEKSLDQRARTVLNVAAELVRRQHDFLVDGVAYLRPLNLRMVADALGIHESTVSRASAHKTLATPRGIFEFRTFFSGALQASAGGEAHAAEAVKHRIRGLISNEDPGAVLSDDAIVARLSGEGVEIARRTVAKYREAMGIGSSVERRRQSRVKAAS
jgi:RNA polymerase sigma-54 factor